MSDFAVDDLEAPPFLIAALTRAGILEPTPVQRQAIPLVLAGQDVIIQSPTGTGKTLAYVLPLLQRVRAEPTFRAVLMAPSPELAVQIARVVEAFAGPGVSSGVIVGGGNASRQRETLKRKPRVVIGTPGRLLEVIFAKQLKTAEIGALVLDETDEILSPQNEPPLRELASRPEFRPQLVFASATIGAKALRLAAELMTPGFTHVVVGSTRVPEHLAHFATTFDEQRKEVSLARLLASQRIKRALVFVNKLQAVAHLHRFLNDQGVATASMSSARSARDREDALRAFKSGAARVLVATDAAARGLDVTGLGWVVHYDVARDPEVYVHRAGRAGRAGEPGSSVTMIARHEAFLLDRYAAALGITFQSLAG